MLYRNRKSLYIRITIASSLVAMTGLFLFAAIMDASAYLVNHS